MRFTTQIRTQGNWLFRWRSFLPLLMAPLFVAALRDFTYPWDSIFMDRLWELFCLAVALAGLGLRIYIVGHVPTRTSGRTTSRPKAEQLNTTGMYSIVRHPIYLANFIVWLGIVLFVHSLLLTTTCALAYCLYYERIIAAEEEFLSRKFQDEYSQWAAMTPMIVPRFRLWRRPIEAFSWQAALTREYPGLLTITGSFTALEIAGDRFYEGKWQLDPMWAIIFGISLPVFLTLWVLKKTNIIKSPNSVKT